MNTPTDIKALGPKRQLVVTWSPLHIAEYGYKYLRCHCGCAVCVDERTGIRRLQPDSIPEDILLEDMSLAGHYALKIRWSDGHDTGLYSWTYLQKLCPCPQCGGPKPYDRRPSPA